MSVHKSKVQVKHVDIIVCFFPEVKGQISVWYTWYNIWHHTSVLNCTHLSSVECLNGRSENSFLLLLFPERRPFATMELIMAHTYSVRVTLHCARGTVWDLPFNGAAAFWPSKQGGIRAWIKQTQLSPHGESRILKKKWHVSFYQKLIPWMTLEITKYFHNSS